MTKNKVSVLLINDFDPAEYKGAASIALDLASRVFRARDFIYLCTSKRATCRQEFSAFRFEYVKESSIDRLRDRVKNRFPELEGLMRVIAIRRLWRLFWLTKKYSPTLVWVHQIGWRFPITSLLLFRALRIPVFLTLHDYSFLRFHKIYPGDFDVDEASVERALINFHTEKTPLQMKLASKPTVWQKLTKCVIAKTSEVIYISDLQSSIYLGEGFPSGIVVNNSVRACVCEDTELQSFKKSDDLKVLFAGRLIGKGLERLIESMKSSHNVHIHLAGRIELLEYVKAKLMPQQFTYHGLLEEKELIDLIHQVDVTAVPSTCFDVFPTITLESLAHGTPVITTPTTGNFNYCREIGSSFALSLHGNISFDLIRQITNSPFLPDKLDNAKKDATNQATINKYRDIFENLK
jgi:glycosyltransferase involved in cell wall biosynthesis